MIEAVLIEMLFTASGLLAVTVALNRAATALDAAACRTGRARRSRTGTGRAGH